MSQEGTFFQAMAEHYQRTYEMKSRSGTLDEDELKQILKEIKGWKDTFDRLEQNLAKLLPPAAVEKDIIMAKLREEVAEADEGVKRLLGFRDDGNKYNALPEGALDVKEYKEQLAHFELRRGYHRVINEEAWKMYFRNPYPECEEEIKKRSKESLDEINGDELKFLEGNKPIDAAAFHEDQLHPLLDKKAAALRALRLAEIAALEK